MSHKHGRRPQVTINHRQTCCGRAFRRFHYKSRNTCPLITTLDAELSDRTIGRSRQKCSMRQSHWWIAALKLRETDGLATEFDYKTHGSQSTAERRKVLVGETR